MCVRVCMRVRMWVRWMAQDAGANGSWSEGTQAPGATTTRAPDPERKSK